MSEELQFTPVEANTKRKELIESTDDLLTHLGGWGRYQTRLLIFFVIFSSMSAHSLYAPVLDLHTPPSFHCSPPPELVFKQKSGARPLTTSKAW